ncbi:MULTISPECIES: hypothetical protein [unclassified Mesorhizobium]|uniref:hypothetical protein n=1 Tax=unclassified Mesorhizobium TaxID=325217 RepID=UPI0007FFC080|nr:MULTISPECIES: hypothetical protein [unclassified Mesorhizobium]RUW06889.1 hypothetical protein EOA53_22370 [Mesorhizobium sp. M1A.F.Ca.IN.020.03.1.1]OBQ89373.1 hypothetical protein A9K66_18325 [Mesorhizobium sp. AA23]RWF75677.1 MAG: hypothetical protein EOQ34_00820 [Mesorhizobium sp.]RWG11973.1 MAG: hypothetical protein EOQ58_22520 [Mesorhizobium sp.]RWG27478.1 MAG: hypothetical protein EOQ61_23615 [Mesorhizobium sp.]
MKAMKRENRRRLLIQLRQQEMRYLELIDQTRVMVAKSSRLVEQSRKLLLVQRSGACKTKPAIVSLAAIPTVSRSL